MRAYSAAASILAGVGGTLIDLTLTSVSSVAIHAMAEIVPKTIVDAGGIILTGILALAGVEIFQGKRVPSQDILCQCYYMYSVQCLCTSLTQVSCIAEVTETLIWLNAVSSILICGQSDGIAKEKHNECERKSKSE